MSNCARFCDATGKELLGSDSLIVIDGRWNQASRDAYVRDRREEFRKHFPHKYFEMTHYVYRGEIRVADCY